MTDYRTFYRKLTDQFGSFEATQLFAHVTGKRPQDCSDLDQSLTEEQASAANDLYQRRAQGVPLQYLLGEWEFYSLPFRVGPGVLIPRQDTELLVDLALEAARSMDSLEILDLCSGSGCVAVSLAHHLPAATVTALEFSAQAVRYLEDNIQQNQVSVQPVLSDLRDYTHPNPIDLLVSNPPYIPRRDLPGLQSEVSHEPLIALDGGEDGLFYYRAIARRYYSQVRPGGQVLLEVGIGQADDVRHILEEYRYDRIECHKDLGGIDRVVTARRPE